MSGLGRIPRVDPAQGPLPTPENQTANKGWNGKLIYAYGGGVQPAYHMGLGSGLNATGTGDTYGEHSYFGRISGVRAWLTGILPGLRFL